jgi:acetylornithine deacetylase
MALSGGAREDGRMPNDLAFDLVPLDPGARRAILEATEELRPNGSSLPADLVRHRSVLGEEQSCLAAMEAAYRDLGLAPRRVSVDPATLADKPGFSPPLIDYAGRDLVVVVHAPPTGRGRSTAIRALRLVGLAPAAELQLAAVIEEECIGNGPLAVMHALPPPDTCLIPEPGPGYPALYAPEVGVVWAWITVTGRSAHARDMQAGVNAIEAAMAVAARFKEDEAEMEPA